jgi:5-dehydro-4-deoxyglucarate dehydratase
VRLRHGDGSLLYFNGLPTAEMSAQAYRAIGAPGYSSAVFCFAPDLALAFYRAYRSGDEATVNRLLDGFWLPYVQLRQQGPEYAVSLVKAGVRLDGTDVGPVRPPLSEPRPEHIEHLADLIARGRTLLA